MLKNRIKVKSLLFFTFCISFGCQKDSLPTETPTVVEPEVPMSFQIIAVSDPKVTTHHLKSGDSGFQIGITSNGGGIINELIIPGVGDIMGVQTDQYGRAGQVAIRDQSHNGRYNPTQAGFNETLGTKCIITSSTGKLTVEPRPMALWHGDKSYDYIRWENIGPDPYTDDNGNSDIDDLDEENLEGKQETEVKSEFDYFGTYEDYYGKNGITAGTIRHYYQISYIRPPGHCINQFRDRGPGIAPFNANFLKDDISVNAPNGVHKGTDKDLNGMIGVWSLRNDVKLWLPTYVYYRTNTGQWKNKLAADATDDIDSASDDRVFISSDGNDINTSKALCLYRPNTDINRNVIIGINETTGATEYKDSRGFWNNITYDLTRTPSLSKYGFISGGNGMINRTRLNSNVYEAYRNEVFILYGSPKQIMDSIIILDKILGL